MRISKKHRPQQLYAGIVIVIVLFLVTGALLYFKPEHSSNRGSHDQQAAQDLSKLTNALLSYGNRHANLPNNLNALRLQGLNAKMSDYVYRRLPPTPDVGPPGICTSTGNGIGCNTAGFTLCAVFTTHGTSSFNYASGKPSTAATFSYHRQGQQCYKYTYGQYGINGDSFAPVQ